MHTASLAFSTIVAATVGFRCDPSWLPISRDPAATAMVVAVEPDTVRDVAKPQFAARGPAREFEASLRGERGSTGTRYGQLVRIVEPGARAAAQRGAEVVLVPWSFSSDCGPVPWTGSSRWIPAGELAFLTAWPRTRESWIGGRPTFDVEVRGWQPTWRTNDARWPHDRERLLTAPEFLLVFESLPTHAQVAARGPARRVVDDLRQRHRSLVAREPARTILANLERHLAAPKANER